MTEENQDWWVPKIVGAISKTLELYDDVVSPGSTMPFEMLNRWGAPGYVTKLYMEVEKEIDETGKTNWIVHSINGAIITGGSLYVGSTAFGGALQLSAAIIFSPILAGTALTLTASIAAGAAIGGLVYAGYSMVEDDFSEWLEGAQLGINEIYQMSTEILPWALEQVQNLWITGEQASELTAISVDVFFENMKNDIISIYDGALWMAEKLGSVYGMNIDELIDLKNEVLAEISNFEDFIANEWEQFSQNVEGAWNDFIDFIAEKDAEAVNFISELRWDAINYTVDVINLVSLAIDLSMYEFVNTMKNLAIFKPFDPVVLDMDGDGIELINVKYSQAQFDFDNDGFNEKAGWVAPDDAFLVFDANNNGVIDDIDEMFGNDTISGFAELAVFDLNSDGKINSNDADPDPEDTISVDDYYDLEIWHDFDGDGITDPGELTSLVAADIVEIDITGIATNQESKGNMITELSTWKDDENNIFTAADVDFKLEQVNSIPQPNGSAITLEDFAVIAPWSRGYGDVYSLQYAMSTNLDLANMVYQLMYLPPEDFYLAYTLVEEILYEWAGTTDVLTESRGPVADGRKLATIEQFTGEAFTNAYGGADPVAGSEPYLDAAWDYLLTLFQERLIVQGPMKNLFPNASYNFFTDSLDLGQDAGDLIANAMTVETNPDRADYWFKFLDFVIEHDLKELDKIVPVEGMTQEQWDDLADNLGTISLSTGYQSNVAWSPWNTYKSEFTADFAALIKAKLGFDLTDIDDDGNLDEEGLVFVMASNINPSVYGGSGVELSANVVYHGPAWALTDTNDFILGGKEDDLIRGYGGHDILYAGTGNDFIYSGDGHNYLFGGAGADVLQSGENAVDVLYGNDGTDYFYLNGQDHTVDGGKGDDSINLDTDANATYIWGMADGNDEVVNSGSNGVGFIQRLVIADDLTANEIRLNTYGGNLVVTNDLTGETFKVDTFVEELDEVHFSDSTVYDIQAGTIFRAHATNASNVRGWNGNDTMVGGTGNDVLDGNGGDDTYVHEVGGGNDTLWSGSPVANDVILMNGVDAENLYFTTVANDLFITDALTGEQLKLMQQLYDTVSGANFDSVNGIDISGGLTARGTSATAGEMVRATNNADTLIGGLGDDTLYGLAGTDTFISYEGDGIDHLYAGGNNDLDIVIMNDVTTGDLYFNVSSNGYDLIVTNDGTGDQVTLDNQFYLTGSGFDFASVNGIDVTTGLTLQGTSSTLGENIYGTPFGDTLDAGLGNDNVYGFSGLDIFNHNSGDGTDHFYAGGVNDLDIVTMNLADGVTALTTAQIYFNVSNNDLVVTDITTGEKFTLHYQYYQTGSGYDFASVNGIDITAGLTIKGTSATAGEYLYGTSLGDTMIGGLGNDIIFGQGGTDIFIHESGDGNDHLYSSGLNDLNTVLMNGVSSNDLFFNKLYNDLVVTDNATGEKLTLDNHFYQTSSGYEFATVNGIDVTGALTIRGAGTLTGTDSNDTVEGVATQNIYYGGNGDDDLIVSQGADWLYGQAGADTFIFTDVTYSTASSITKIKDFISGTDIIDLSAISTIDEFSDLTLTEVSGRTYVDDNGSDFFFHIEGSGSTGLDASDFIFT